MNKRISQLLADEKLGSVDVSANDPRIMSPWGPSSLYAPMGNAAPSYAFGARVTDTRPAQPIRQVYSGAAAQAARAASSPVAQREAAAQSAAAIKRNAQTIRNLQSQISRQRVAAKSSPRVSFHDQALRTGLTAKQKAAMREKLLRMEREQQARDSYSILPVNDSESETIDRPGPIATNQASEGGAMPVKPINKAEAARMQFVTWLKNTHPELYAEAVKRTEAWREKMAAASGRPATIEGLNETTGESQSWWEKLTETVTTLGTSYLSYKNQQDAIEINLERAQQGLPPIDMSQSAPVVRTQIDVTPEIAERLRQTSGEVMKKTLLIAGAGLAAVLLLRKK